MGLRNFYDNHRQKFLSRLSKGPPIAYRWLAWRFMANQILPKDKGLYEQQLEEGIGGQWLHDIDKDLGRTYPTHPFFDVTKDGEAGQRTLRNILQAYAVYNDDVGYC